MFTRGFALSTIATARFAPSTARADISPGGVEAEGARIRQDVKLAAGSTQPRRYDELN